MVLTFGFTNPQIIRKSIRVALQASHWERDDQIWMKGLKTEKSDFSIISPCEFGLPAWEQGRARNSLVARCERDSQFEVGSKKLKGKPTLRTDSGPKKDIRKTTQLYKKSGRKNLNQFPPEKFVVMLYIGPTGNNGLPKYQITFFQMFPTRQNWLWKLRKDKIAFCLAKVNSQQVVPHEQMFRRCAFHGLIPVCQKRWQS